MSTYVDTDGDGRLSQKERDAVTWIGNYPYADAWWKLDEIKYKKKVEKEALELIGEVRSFAGIEYFENLEEIRLIEYGAYVTNVEKLYLCNPKLQRILVGNIETLQDFSVKAAGELRLFWCETKQCEVDWSSVQKLEYLQLCGCEVSGEALLKNSALKDIDLLECSLTDVEEMQDFSKLQELEEFYFTNTESGDCAIRAWNFGRNPNLKQLNLSVDASGVQAVVPSFEVEFDCNCDKGQERMELIVQAEQDFVIPENLPEGSLVLDAEHFPDVAFRQYLYFYVDMNRDCILSQEERDAVTRLRSSESLDYDKDYGWNEANDGEPYWEDIIKYRYARCIKSLKGLEYFPNLYEIQLERMNLADEELNIANPNLEIVHMSYSGAPKKIRIDCPKLRVCNISFNSENTMEADTGETPELELNSAENLWYLRLNGLKFASWEKLSDSEKLEAIAVRRCTMSEDDVLQLEKLESLKYLELYVQNEVKLEMLDLSRCPKLWIICFEGVDVETLLRDENRGEREQEESVLGLWW